MMDRHSVTFARERYAGTLISITVIPTGPFAVIRRNACVDACPNYRTNWAVPRHCMEFPKGQDQFPFGRSFPA